MEIKYKKKIAMKISKIRKLPISRLVCVLVISVVEYLAIEISLCSPKIIFRRNIKYQIAGVIIILFINLLIRLLFRKKVYIAVADILSVILCLVFPMISFYTYRLHGTPFTLSDIKNAKTAANVLGLYIRDILKPTIRHALWLAALSFNVVITHFSEKHRGMYPTKKGKMIEGVMLSISGVCIAVTFRLLLPAGAVSWNFMETVYSYGYIPCLISSSIAESNALIEPKGYSTERVEKFIEEIGEKEKESNNKPDIIVILNETFYDLNKIIDVKVSENPITYLSELENCYKGYAVVPNEGGGTNLSEWELLTGNSTSILQNNITPFQSLDLKDANSVVSMLKAQGYTTLAAHNCPGINYNRLNGYSELGFDTVRFEEDFDDLVKWGNRGYYTDESSYDDIIDWYTDMGDGPRFLYFLTIQNHSPWDSNEYGQNPVHVLSNLGNYTEQLSEFESCIYYSDKAVSKVVDYLSNSDRDAIVIMVGDHCPGILLSCMDEYFTDYDEELRKLNLRSVPYFVWTNNSQLLSKECESDYLSLFFLIPTVLNTAGVPVSNYYYYLADLKQEVPIITKYGAYYDSLGNMYRYGDNTQYTDVIGHFFDIEYANIKLDVKSGFFK